MKPSTIVLTLSGILWILAITAWSFAMVIYQFAPGSAATPPTQWPLSSRIHLSPDRATLIMLAHPQCPCTHASIAELSRLLSHNKDKVKAYVLFFTPKSLPVNWQERTALREETERIPGVTVLDDIDLAEAKRFQAITSGQTFLYNPKGDLLFSGGITAARGEIGDSAGWRSLVSVLDSRSPVQPRTALVFGCPLTTAVEK